MLYISIFLLMLFFLSFLRSFFTFNPALCSSVVVKAPPTVLELLHVFCIHLVFFHSIVSTIPLMRLGSLSTMKFLLGCLITNMVFVKMKRKWSVHTEMLDNRDSVVGIVTGYGLDDRGVGIRVPVRSIIFSSPQTGAEVHPMFYPMCTGAVSLGVKRPGREANLSPTSAEVMKMWLYTSTPPYAFMVGLVCSYCSHLEHRASVKRFVSLQFLNLRHSVGLLGRVISPSQGRYLTRTQSTHKQTSIPRVGFEPMIPVFEREKAVHALDRAATVIGTLSWRNA
jgi:hypothetical protein